MNRTALLGGVLFAAGLIGYAVGIHVPYPGRSFTITAIMLGGGLLALDGPRWFGSDEP